MESSDVLFLLFILQLIKFFLFQTTIFKWMTSSLEYLEYTNFIYSVDIEVIVKNLLRGPFLFADTSIVS